MQRSVDRIHFLTGNAELLAASAFTPALPTWSERTVDFFSSFSRNLLKDPRTKEYVDITAYAFWIRNASLRQIKEHYYPHVESKIGRGVAFHIAPSNVPINFAVSFTSSLLAGNVNIVRLSNKPFEQVPIIIDSLKKTFDNGFQDMEKYLILIRYEHDEEITQYISSLCDVRIIWGGNQTIEMVRKAKLPPRAIEMAFADRHSIALLNADAVVDADTDKLAEDFYVDTYYTDQNACSSPRIVIWFGERIEEAKRKFWKSVNTLVESDYEFREIQAIDKLEQFCLLATEYTDVALEDRNNMIMRICVQHLDEQLMNFKLGGGYFFEYSAKDLSEIAPIMNKPCQTISYYGLDGHAIQDFIIRNGLRGGDRITPVGKTMDLTFKWDGFDMIETMSKYVYCPDYLTINKTK